jgi:hypothetical protein
MSGYQFSATCRCKVYHDSLNFREIEGKQDGYYSQFTQWYIERTSDNAPGKCPEAILGLSGLRIHWSRVTNEDIF